MKDEKSNNLVLNQGTIDLISLALKEDLGPECLIVGDITTSSTIKPNAKGKAEIIAKEDLVICGHSVAEHIFKFFDPSCNYEIRHKDGELVHKGQVVCTIGGIHQALLVGERVSLNFMQRLSGIATTTAKLVRLAGKGVQLLDTRKTTPGMRQLEKYAVQVGGGTNHRFGLYDEVLIKNNHIDSLNGDVKKAIELSRKHNPKGTKIIVEVRNQSELEAAVEENPDVILLDNYFPTEMNDAVWFVRNKNPNVKVEASGGINEENLMAYVATGVDRISLGALTHSVRSVDLSMRITS